MLNDVFVASVIEILEFTFGAIKGSCLSAPPPESVSSTGGKFKGIILESSRDLCQAGITAIL